MTKKFELTMAAILIAMCALMFVGCAQSASDSPALKVKSDAEIINGTIANDADGLSKSTVIVITYSKPLGDMRICSGSLIARDVVVTAAHCLVDSNSVRLPESYFTYVLFQLSANVFDANFLANALVVSADQAVPHEGYSRNDPALANDVALIHLPRLAPAYAQTVPLLKNPAIVFLARNIQVLLAGYGISTADGRVEKRTGLYRLRWMWSHVLPFDKTITGIVPVSGTPLLRTGEGDSGGPAFVNVNGDTYLFGADSAGNDTQTSYTNLAIQVPWLKATAARLGAATNF